jgi:hypothetical protein
MRSGERENATAFVGAMPIAARGGTLALLSSPSIAPAGGPIEDGGLRLYRAGQAGLDTVRAGPMTLSAATAALSPDGARLAYPSAIGFDVYLFAVNLVTLRRDSIDVSGRADLVAGPQIEFSTPVYSPSGDSIVFILPNPVTVQMVIYEVPTRRLEQHVLLVPVSTQYALLRGWPRWADDGSLRLLARERTRTGLGDSLFVVKVFPRQRDRSAEIAYRAALPDSLRGAEVGSYSFDASGDIAVFTLRTAAGRRGIFALRAGQSTLETLLYDASVRPVTALVWEQGDRS